MYCEKQKNIFNILKKVFTILCVLFILGLAIQVVCMLGLSLVPDKFSDTFEAFKIWKPFVTSVTPYRMAIAELCVSMISYSFAVFFTKNATEIFKELEKEERLSSKKLKKVGIVTLIYFVLSPIVHKISFGVFVKCDYLKYSPDIELLIVGLILIGLSMAIAGKEEI